MIFKRKDTKTGKPSKKWSYDFSIKGQRFRGSCYTEDKYEAMLYVEQIRKKAFERIVLNIKEPTFEELANYYLNHNLMALQMFSIARKSQYKLAIKEGLQYFQNKPFNQENTYKFLNYIESRRKLTKSTVTKYIDVLSSLCKFAQSHNEMTDNFLLKMDFSVYKKEKRKIRYRFLSKEEYELLSSACIKYNPNLFNYIYFALNTGLRLGEQIELTWDRIDIANKIIYIDKTKTDKPRRLKLLDDTLVTILQQRKSIDGPFVISKSTLNSQWQVVLKKANINNFKWHDLRHTFASWAIMGWHSWQHGQKMSLAEVQKYLGHSSIDMTMRYAHLED